MTLFSKIKYSIKSDISLPKQQGKRRMKQLRAYSRYKANYGKIYYYNDFSDFFKANILTKSILPRNSERSYTMYQYAYDRDLYGKKRRHTHLFPSILAMRPVVV